MCRPTAQSHESSEARDSTVLSGRLKDATVWGSDREEDQLLMKWEPPKGLEVAVTSMELTTCHSADKGSDRNEAQG